MKVVAVIGCGHIANGQHFLALTNLEDVRIKYACDLIEEKAQKSKANFPKIENVITDYNIALNDPEVDAVFVLTPNYAHYTVTMDALKAGKHVLCEKPITVNYKLSCEMKEEADKRGLMLDIGVCNRHNVSVEKLKDMYDNGEFGKVYHVNCSFRSCRNIPGIGGSFTTKSESGGGVLIDWGVHFLDLALYILGMPKLQTVTCNTYGEIGKDVKAYKFKSMWGDDLYDPNGTFNVDDYVVGLIRTDAASIMLNGAWAQNVEHEEFYVDILGDKKGARFHYGARIEVFDGDTLITDAPDYELPNMYQREDRAFLDSIDTKVKTRGNIDYVLESARLLDLLYESAASNKEIAVNY